MKKREVELLLIENERHPGNYNFFTSIRSCCSLPPKNIFKVENNSNLVKNLLDLASLHSERTQDNLVIFTHSMDTLCVQDFQTEMFVQTFEQIIAPFSKENLENKHLVVATQCKKKLTLQPQNIAGGIAPVLADFYIFDGGLVCGTWCALKFFFQFVYDHQKLREEKFCIAPNNDTELLNKQTAWIIAYTRVAKSLVVPDVNHKLFLTDLSGQSDGYIYNAEKKEFYHINDTQQDDDFEKSSEEEEEKKEFSIIEEEREEEKEEHLRFSPFFIHFPEINSSSSNPLTNYLQPHKLSEVGKNYLIIGKSVNGVEFIPNMPVHKQTFLRGLWTERAIMLTIIVVLFFLIATCFIFFRK